MSLPKLKFPVYTITLPVAKKKLQFRPYLAKEEKLLLMGQNSGDVGYIVDVVKQVLNNCMISDFDLDTMALTDIEYFFLKLRGKSVGEVAEIWIKDPEDGKRYTVQVNLDNATVTKNTNESNKIDLGEDIGLVMKTPTLEVLKQYAVLFDPERAADEDADNRILQASIDTIYDADNVYDLKQETQEEIDNFLGQLSPKNLEDIEKYFNGLPKVTLVAKYVTEKGDKTLTLEGLPSFFQLG